MRRILVGLILIASNSTMGCEEHLRSPDGIEIPFSLYGVITPDADTQSIRLYPLSSIPTRGSPAPPTVEVASIDVETRERLVWIDSVLVDPNGTYEYVYWAPFRAKFDADLSY